MHLLSFACARSTYERISYARIRRSTSRSSCSTIKRLRLRAARRLNNCSGLKNCSVTLAGTRASGPTVREPENLTRFSRSCLSRRSTRSTKCELGPTPSLLATSCSSAYTRTWQSQKKSNRPNKETKPRCRETTKTKRGEFQMDKDSFVQ